MDEPDFEAIVAEAIGDFYKRLDASDKTPDEKIAMALDFDAFIQREGTAEMLTSYARHRWLTHKANARESQREAN